MSFSEIFDGIVWRTRAPVSFIRSVLRNPCTTFITGRLVMQNLRGASRPANADSDNKIVDVAFPSLHSSRVSMMTRHGGKAFSRIAARRGFMTSFSSCLDGSEYCTSGSFTIASDKCFWKEELNNDN